MSTLRTAGELRGFLVDVLVGLKDGTIDTNKANAIAKVSAQINASLAVEVNTALQLDKIGMAAGSMVIDGSVTDVVEALPPPTPQAPTPKPAATTPPVRTGDKIWCEQCDQSVHVNKAVSCNSPHCKAKTFL